MKIGMINKKRIVHLTFLGMVCGALTSTIGCAKREDNKPRSGAQQDVLPGAAQRAQNGDPMSCSSPGSGKAVGSEKGAGQAKDSAATGCNAGAGAMAPQGASASPGGQPTKPGLPQNQRQSQQQAQQQAQQQNDASVKTALLSRDELAFIQKSFTSIFEAEFRQQELEDFLSSDLGRQSRAVLKPTGAIASGSRQSGAVLPDSAPTDSVPTDSVPTDSVPTDSVRSDSVRADAAKAQTPSEASARFEITMDLQFVSRKEVVRFEGVLNAGEVATLSNQSRPEVSVRAACADDKCDLLIGYAWQQINEQQRPLQMQQQKKKMIGTFIFKRSGAEHLSVQLAENQEEDESSASSSTGAGASSSGQSAPQDQQNFAVLRAERNLIAGVATFGERIVDDLKQRIKSEGAWYSPYPFVSNLVSERVELALNADGTLQFDLKQMFNPAAGVSRLKDYALSFKGRIGEPITVNVESQNIEVTWTQLTANFGYALFQTKKYVSYRDSTQTPRTAYFIKWCGFEPVSVNNVTIQLDKCDFKASAEFLGTKTEDGKIEYGKDEGGL